MAFDPTNPFSNYFSTAMPAMPYSFSPSSLADIKPYAGTLAQPAVSASKSTWFQQHKVKLVAIIVSLVVAIVLIFIIKKRKNNKEDENVSMTNHPVPAQLPPQQQPQQPQQPQRPVSLDPSRPPPMPSHPIDGTMRLPTMVNPGANGMYPTANPPTPFPSLQQQPQMPTQQPQGQVPVPINAGDEMTDPNFTPLPKARR